MTMRLIYLARHGDIAVDKEKRYIGQTDLELNERGLQQAKALQQTFTRMHIDKIFASSLQRSIQTAIIIGAGHELNPVIMRKLDEINMGAWEGQTFVTVKSIYPESFAMRGEDPAGFRPPGGESFSDLYHRVIPAFESAIKDSLGDIVIVAHAGVNRVILSYVLGLPLVNIFRLKQNYGCLNVISYDGESYCLEILNELPAMS